MDKDALNTSDDNTNIHSNQTRFVIRQIPGYSSIGIGSGLSIDIKVPSPKSE